MAGTGIRNRHRVGRHLMLDDESGFVMYDDQARRIWDGTWRRKDQFETRQPQEFVYARNDPRALRHIRPEPKLGDVDNTIDAFVNGTTVEFPIGAAAHLFEPGIGKMVIEGSTPQTRFRVR